MTSGQEKTIPAVCYELVTLLEASQCYEQAKIKKDWSAQSKQEKFACQNLCNFALESFLVHYRNLDEFFQNMGADDCVNAKDYANWPYKRSTLKSPSPNHHPRLAPESEIKRIHKRLAHISVERSASNEDWPIEEMKKNICTVFEEFISAMPANDRPKFEYATEAIRLRAVQAEQRFLTSWQNSTTAPTTYGNLFYPTDYVKFIK